MGVPLEVKDKIKSDDVNSDQLHLINLSLYQSIKNLTKNTFESLENRNFMFLWFGMVFSMGGIQMQILARGILVYDLTNNYFITGLVGMGFAPSLLIISLFGGVLGDLIDRKLIIQLSQFFNAIISGLVGILIMFDMLIWEHLFVASMMQGAVFAFMMPPLNASIPSLVKKHQLTNAFALNAMAMSVMSLLAPSVAGVLYQFKGPIFVYFSVCSLMVISVIFTSFSSKMYPPEKSVSETILENILSGFKYIWGNKLLLQLMIYNIILTLLAMPFTKLVPAFAKDVYESNGSEVGVLLTSAGLGSLIASVFIANLKVGQHRRWFLIGAGIISGLSLSLISGLPVFGIGLISMLGIGLSEQIRGSLGQSLMMENTEDEYRSRIMSVLMMTYGLIPLGMFPLGWAMNIFGGRLSVGFCSVIIIGFVFLSIFFFPHLKRIK